MEGFLQRTSLLIGEDGIQRLQNSFVMVIGLGGVGSYAAEALARSGIGHLTLVDRDRVEASNINRQLPALHSTLGRFKCEVMAERIRDINPDIDLRVLPVEYTPETADKILDRSYDFVVDAIDSLTDKIHLIEHCLKKACPSLVRWELPTVLIRLSFKSLILKIPILAQWLANCAKSCVNGGFLPG